METIKLSRLQAGVHFMIRRYGPINATQIGSRLGYKYDTAAQSMNRPLKYLVEKGLIVRNSKNSRVVSYVAAGPIDPPFELLPDGIDGDNI